MLKEGVRDHYHERVSVQALPGPSLEVIGTEFFFICWWACSQIHSALMMAARVRRFVSAGGGEIVFLLS